MKLKRFSEECMAQTDALKHKRDSREIFDCEERYAVNDY